MRVLGLDLGSKRIGVAVSDGMGWTARGVGVLAAPKALAEIEALVKTEEIARIVVGMPVHDDGRPSKSARSARRLLRRW